MHGLKIFLHRVIFLETLAVIPILPRTKRLMLNRLKTLFSRQIFRDRHGTSYRRKLQIFSGAGMSAKDKVALIFLLPHVLGYNADVLEDAIRQPLLTALAYAQLLIIATSGLRSYTEGELDVLFHRGYITLFGALQTIHAVDYDKKLSLHLADPDKVDAPKPPKIQQRCKHNVLGLFHMGTCDLISVYLWFWLICTCVSISVYLWFVIICTCVLIS